MVSRVKTWTQEVLTHTDLNAEFDNLISSLNGGQFVFPATQNASADANTLDDYEEGTFTPTLRFGTGTTGITYSTRLGAYTKIGNRCMGEINVALSSKGSSTGTADISGLPFTTGTAPVNSASGAAEYVTFNTAGGFYSLYPVLGASGTLVTLQETGSNVGFTDLTDADFANNSNVRISFNYKVA